MHFRLKLARIITFMARESKKSKGNSERKGANFLSSYENFSVRKYLDVKKCSLRVNDMAVILSEPGELFLMKCHFPNGVGVASQEYTDH
jgi:hypothetical protein